MTFQELLRLPNLNKAFQALGEEGVKNLESLKDYKDFVKLRIQGLSGRAKEIGEAYQKYYIATYSNRYEVEQELKKVLFDGKDTMEQVLEDGLSGFFHGLLPEEMAEKHCNIILRQQDCIYNHSSYRRSFRSTHPSAYFHAVTSIMRSVYFNWYDFDLVAYLTMSDEEIKEKKIARPDSFMVSALLALEIDNQNSRVIEVVKDVIVSENNTKIIDHTFTRGMAKSHSKEIHNLMRDLLLAAKLQEGLRQVILETADDGTIEYFILMVETILEHNLLRFSSCLRAVCTWMGLGYGYEDKRVVEKLLTLGHTYLADAGKRREACDSKDVIEMFSAMWAESVYSLEGLYAYIRKYMEGEKYQKMVSFYFLNQTNYETTSLACDYLQEEDLDVLAWVLLNYNIVVGWARDKETYFNNAKNNPVLSDSAKRQWQFDRLVSILQRIPKDGYIVSQKPFDWCHVVISRDDIYNRLLVVNSYELDAAKTSTLIDLVDYAPSDGKIKLIDYFLDAGSPGKDRDFLFASLSDKSMPVRIAAAKTIKALALEQEELLKIENLLALKTGEIRQIALDIIKSREPAEICQSVDRLIQDKSENKRLGALDVLTHLLDKGQADKEKVVSYLSLMPKVTERERILVEALKSENTQQYTLDNGFGLYEVSYRPDFPPLEISPAYTLETFKAESVDRCIEVFLSLVEVVKAHKDYTFLQKNWDDSETEIILGNLKRLIVPADQGKVNDRELGFDKMVLADVWRTWAEDNGVSLLTVSKLNFAKKLLGYGNHYEVKYEPWATELIETYFDVAGVQKLGEFFKENKEFFPLARDILSHLPAIYDEAEIADLNCSVLADLISKTGEDDWTKVAQKQTNRYSYNNSETLLKDLRELNIFISELDRVVSEGPAFERRVALCYEIGRISGYQYVGLDEVEVAMAVTWGVLPVNELYRTFFRQEPSRKMLNYTGTLSHKTKANIKKYPVLKEVSEAVVQRVIDIEVKRGDTKTEVSHMAHAIRWHEGIQNFVDVLLALGNETLTRGYHYGGDDTKKDVMSSLLKASVPAPGDDAKALKKAVGGRISDKRLLEAAMYAPAWISIIEKYLGWKGLKSGAWYFHAHTSSSFSAEFETEVARFSPISKEDFRDGAFDVKWFKSAYKAMGAERFDILYACAKYISDGAEHRRAQMFADAALGKMDLAETQAKIADKRNKDLMLSYSLIPFGKAKMKDALGRYEFIQGFLKESKQFGAQRRASEAKICEIALANLARNLGFDDITRFSWKMEILKLDQIARYFKPKEVEDCTVYIDEATANIVVLKGGKALKSIPAKLKKNPYIEELKATKSALSAQFKRAKASFERAMEFQDEFPYGEILDLMKHPVIRPIITKLVFVAGENIGFLTGEGMQAIDGSIIPLDKKTNLVVAHSYNLYQSGKWSEFQRYAFENELVQPFKQIFRELYLINEDERKEKTISRRYAGNQVQPKKTVALLKGRSWTVDYDSGLQKVYYRENIIATMYALADWFSPADVEAPTLETVEFRDRNTYKPVAFEDLPPVLFSETMRDVDLVVSVAHVGGVDPMASHSTIEMRSMIVREIASLLKLSNVTVDGSHSKIIGKKGEYSVHLGSGIAHMSGKGALNILPVHSQHRGKVFLPFLDEDPKTAEILSKILLLAEDDKIKDATILSQIIQ